MLLLSYISQQGPQKRQQLQGFPIKAVYRDAVVGIRYLHGEDTITEPVYRRFQITFMTSSAVLEFVDAIRSICPCKANPSTTLGCDTAVNTRATLDLPTTGVRPPITAHPRNPTSSQLLYRHASLVYVPQKQCNLAPIFPAQLSIIDSQAPFSSTPTPSTSRTEAQLIRRSPINMERDVLQSPSALIPRRPNNDHFSPTFQVGSETQTAKIPMTAVSRVTPDGQGPPKQNSLLRPPSPISSASNNISQDFDVMLSSLRHCSALYDLPQSTLEKIVGDIVREDDFVKLVSICLTVWKNT
ncbi:hypothetical protein BDZ94DRAFT_1267427 [Collybia nuda]|uniref:Uncharacterized protein n=1 Tax=Collybia nuda TaxID=64659 RepID=A0A9P6CBQ7_9AGAR|nr:hypothetical protein BDZ94DRAFT_1267427 [Collybia nuda]